MVRVSNRILGIVRTVRLPDISLRRVLNTKYRLTSLKAKSAETFSRETKCLLIPNEIRFPI